jgi:6,7-dimethyl-8-ribityllumazine synthase
MSTNAPAPSAAAWTPPARVALIAARFNAEIVNRLEVGCLQRLAEMGASDACISIHRVPGAFELPLAALAAAKTGRFAAVICLGAVIRGDTPHFDLVAGEAARGIREAALQTGIPIIFGVLTTNTVDQALDRAGGKHGHAGRSAAEAAAEMVQTLRSIRADATG